MNHPSKKCTIRRTGSRGSVIVGRQFKKSGTAMKALHHHDACGAATRGQRCPTTHYSRSRTRVALLQDSRPQHYLRQGSAAASPPPPLPPPPPPPPPPPL